MPLLHTLYKIPPLLGIIWANHVAYTSPTPVVTKKAAVISPSTGYVTRNIRPPWVRLVSKTVMRLVVLSEIFAIASLFLPIPLDVVKRETCARIRFAPTFAIGWMLLMAGALIRKACYREMGKHFTFEITIHEDHRLVTSGPYSFVRHPSYFAMCLVATGSALCLLGEGSWLVECGILDSSIGRTFAVFWFADMCFAPAVMLFTRVKVEDDMLKKTFGKQWEDWAKRTPYAVIPGIY